MNHLKHKLLNLLLLLIFPFLGFGYTYFNTTTSSSTELRLLPDDLMPFIPAFIIPYILWYAFIFFYLIYFCFKDSRIYLQTLVTIVIGEIICFVCYIFFQTTVTRPEITGNGFLLTLVQWIYNNDEPYNCFPSIHVLTTYAIMLASIQINRKHIIHTIIIQTMGILIILSTLFTKQHVIMDVIASILIVSILYSSIVAVSSNQYLKPERSRKKFELRSALRKKRTLGYVKSEK